MQNSWPAVSGFSQPGLLVSLIGLGNYPQDPSAYGPTRPSHSYGQDEQGGYSAGRGNYQSPARCWPIVWEQTSLCFHQ